MTYTWYWNCGTDLRTATWRFGVTRTRQWTRLYLGPIMLLRYDRKAWLASKGIGE